MSGTSNNPFSPRRRRSDLVAVLPEMGMLCGSLLGVLLGLLNPAASAVAFAGIGIGAGVVPRLFLRIVFRSGGPDHGTG